jgi:D-sedoheptulose 7-phosphate isomerase
MHPHIAQLIQRLPALEICAEQIEGAFSVMRDSYTGGGKLLLAGNGGSGADAEHWAGELLKGFLSKRRLGEIEREKMGDALADKLQGGLPAIPLTGFTALRTAWLNDCDPHYLYAQLVYALGRPGDVLVGISTSGNSKNVCHALDTAKKAGIKTIGLTGAGGGRVFEIADLTIRVPADRVHIIQEYHLPVYHTLCLMLEDAFFPEV